MSEKSKKKYPKATTDEGRLNECIGLARDLAYEKLLDGTASATTINLFLKMGSPEAKKEMELKEEQLKLTKAKTEAIESAKRVEELYAEAMKAYGIYSGKDI